jgi:hypothetical protein
VLLELILQSSVLIFCSSGRQKKKKKERKKPLTHGVVRQLAATVPEYLGLFCALKDNLKVSHCTFALPMYWHLT